MDEVVLFGWVVGFLAGVAAFSSRSTLIRPVLIAGAVLAFGAWIPLLGLVALNAALETVYSGNALELGLLGLFGSMLGGVVPAVGLVMRSWEWVTSIQGGAGVLARPPQRRPQARQHYGGGRSKADGSVPSI